MPMSSSPLQRMVRSAGRWWWLKAIGTAGFMGGFFALYFHLLHHPVRPVTVMPLTALDRAMPFVPAALWVYVSLWVYVCLPPSLMRDLRRLVSYGLWCAVMCGVGLLVFWRWPTAVAPATEAATRAPGFDLLRGVDAAGNAFPSLHVATAVFSMLWLDRLLAQHGAGLGWRTASVAWGIAIVLSTMAIRQHVSWDVAGGIVLAGLTFAASWSSMQRACPGVAHGAPGYHRPR